MTDTELEPYTDGDFVQTATMFNDKTFSDAKLIFGEQCIYVHCAVLAKQSEYFHRAFAGDFNEAKSREIHLPAEEFEIWYLVIHMLYCDEEKIRPSLNSLRLDNCFQFLAIVEYIQATRFRIHVVERVVELLRAAAACFARDEAEGYEIKEIGYSTRAIYKMNRTDSFDLRQALVLLYTRSITRATLKNGAFNEVFRDVPELTLDILCFARPERPVLNWPSNMDDENEFDGF